MEQRALIAVAISLFILVIYQGLILPTLYPTPPPQLEEQVLPTNGAAPENPAPAAAPEHPEEAAAPVPPADLPPPKRITVETDNFIATINSRGARFESFALKKFHTTVDPKSAPQEIIVPGVNGDIPIALELRGESSSPGQEGRTAVLSDNDAPYAVAEGPAQIRLSGDQTATIQFDWVGPGGTIRKTFSFGGDRSDVSLAVHAEHVPAQFRELGLSYVTGEKAGTETLFDRISYLQGRKLIERRVGSSNLRDGEVVGSEPGWLWSGIAGRYFLAALVPIDAHSPRLWLKQRDTTLEQKVLFALSGTTFDQQVDLYIGSKRIQALEAVGHNLPLAVDMGWFSFIALPLLWLLRHSHRVTGNYGIDIILLTVTTKVLFLPLTRKSFQSMREMQKLQPQMNQIREQFKDNSEEMNKRVMELYRTHGVNPLGGCLPMIVQMPVFIGLYQALSNAVELRHAPFFLWINDLSAPDRLGSVQIPFIEPAGIPVLTLVMGASMFAQQRMSPATGDPTQRQMMMIMPLVFTFMFVSFPAGLVLYWTVNNVLTVAQQYYINRSSS